MAGVGSKANAGPATVARHFADNRLLAALKPSDRALIEPAVELVELSRGEVLFDPGEDVVATHFPTVGTMVSFVLFTRDGRACEAATVGSEGAVGGIVSSGSKPAFSQAVTQIPGTALRIACTALDEAKERSAALRELFARYADALLAQIMQSVACNALHSNEARLARWLLTTQDRVEAEDIPLTQEFLAEMLGVHRATVVRAARPLQDRGLIRYSRGRITILHRSGLELASCECYGAVARHFERVLPEVVPQLVGGTATHAGSHFAEPDKKR